MEIKILTFNHWENGKRIYLEGIATGKATFQTEAPDWNFWNNAHTQECRFVATENEKVLGWAALSKVSVRPVYSGVAEVSIYVGENARGKGIGKALLEKLIQKSEANDYWTLQSGIFPENTESINLHKKMGFREIGFREKVGMLNGLWRDTVLFERRSKIVGVN